MAFTRASLIALASFGAAGEADAQSAPSLEADNVVLSRPRPGLDAEGLPLGGFRLYPTLGASFGYDDNIYATQTDKALGIEKVASPVLEFDPSVSLQSQWSRHSFRLDAGGTIQRYTDRTSEDNNQYKISGTGHLDLPHESGFDLEAHAQQTTEQRGTPGDRFTAGNPIQYHDLGGTTGASTTLGRLNLSIGGEFDRLTYGSVKIGGIESSQSYRDRRHYGATGGLSYNISPSIQPFVSITYNRERYDVRSPITQSFDSHGTTVLGGINISLTKLITGRVGFGYRWREYRNPSYQNSNGLTYDVALVWNPRTLMAVTLEAIKAIDESPAPESSGILRNQGSVTVDYELLRNVILQVAGTDISEKYRGTNLHDNRFVASFGARYLMNRFVEVGLKYDHTRQTGTSLFRGAYTDNNVRLVLTLQR